LKVNTSGQANLAAKYASLLHRMHERCANDSRFRIDVLGYANELRDVNMASTHVTTTDQEVTSDEEAAVVVLEKNNQQQTRGNSSHIQVPETQDVPGSREHPDNGNQARKSTRSTGCDEPFPPAEELPTPQSLHPEPAQFSINQGSYPIMHPTNVPAVPRDDIGTDDFTYISQMFLNQQFLDRDRVICYDEGMFAANMDGWE
jgi:hypothetical protein